MITKNGQPISGGAPQFRAQRPVLTDAASPSSDAQRIISQGPAIFANEYGIANVPAPTNQNFQRKQTAGLPAKGNYGTKTGGYEVTNVGIASAAMTDADMMAAVGYGPKDTMSNNPIISGRPTQNNQRRVGGGNQGRAKGRR